MLSADLLCELVKKNTECGLTISERLWRAFIAVWLIIIVLPMFIVADVLHFVRGDDPEEDEYEKQQE